MYFLTRLQNGCQVKQAVPRQFRCFLSNPDHPVRLVGARVQRSTAADVRTVNAELLRADCNRTAARGACACLPSPLESHRQARGSSYARTANDLLRPPTTAAAVTIAVAVRIAPFSTRLPLRKRSRHGV
jgi:hypothetical protein